MQKSTTEHIDQRKNEIMKACRELYKTMSFKDITLKEISTMTSFSRPTIYNYFETKEEIFLELFKEEYDCWSADLTALTKTQSNLSNEKLAEEIAKTVDRHKLMLKLLSMNLYDMEKNSRFERLVEFKKSYGKVLNAMKQLIARFNPDMTDRELRSFQYAFFPFMFGIYPYAFATEKQKEAMNKAGIDYSEMSVYELTYQFLCKALANK